VCLNSDLLKGIVVERDVMVPMGDGIRLGPTSIGPTRGGPTRLTRTPYPITGGAMEPMASTATRQGYATIVQHHRGRYGSQGEFYPLHPEVEDGYDTVEWAAGTVLVKRQGGDVRRFVSRHDPVVGRFRAAVPSCRYRNSVLAYRVVHVGRQYLAESAKTFDSMYDETISNITHRGGT
jgi:hypothetical protein